MDDSKIIDLYWARDPYAISMTNVKYGPYCSAIAYNVLESRQDAEECVNDTWLRAWNTMPPQRPNILSAFLGKITRNLALTRRERDTAQKRGGGQSALILEELGDCVSGKEDVGAQVEYQELLAAINDFLTTLPERKRVLFLRRYWYTDSIADAAARCGMSVSTAAMALTRLRKDLRRYLLERGFDL